MPPFAQEVRVLNVSETRRNDLRKFLTWIDGDDDDVADGRELMNGFVFHKNNNGCSATGRPKGSNEWSKAHGRNVDQ